MHAALPRHIAAYYDTLKSFDHHGASTEGATRIAFQTLLSEAGKKHGFTVLGEQTIQLANKKSIRFDGEVKDQFRMRRGVWEAKDTGDDLDTEIRKKIAVGYPTKNTIFENTQRAVLYQNGTRVSDVDITLPGNLQQLLDTFFDYTEPMVEEFHQAVTRFRTEIPALAAGLTAIIDQEKIKNKTFRAAMETFWELCKTSLNPSTTLAQVEDMLKQHLLTERIFSSVFNNSDFVRRNAIARELERVIDALTSQAFSRSLFLGKLDYFYKAIELAATTITDYSEKQSFLNTVYEQFFQSYSTKSADTHGIVYTPAPLVRWMVNSVEQALKTEFGLNLGDQGVHILDPCVGTGTFILELMERISPSALPHKYAHELHCNEVLLLPYYIAAQNIEHEYFERTGQYAPFEGICFADTLDMGRTQLNLFAPENTQRIQQQENAPVFVIVGNPPYNSKQMNDNDNNKNRKYTQVDKSIQDTYVRSSKATLNTKLYDMYVRFFRWATDRLADCDGLICFVSNGSFLEQFAFDGMRKELAKDFTAIYTLDLGGNVRQNPKLSGTTHNVFGIQVSVAITLLIRNRKGQPQSTLAPVHYARVDELWRKEQKYHFLDTNSVYDAIPWQVLKPDARGTWLTGGMSVDFDTFPSLGSKAAKASIVGTQDTIFKTYSLGINSARDWWVYDFDKDSLIQKIKIFISSYNEQLFRWNQRENSLISVDDFVTYNESKVKWSRNLKRDLLHHKEIKFQEILIQNALYRPFLKQYLYFSEVIIDEQGKHKYFFPITTDISVNLAFCITGVGAEKPFAIFISNAIPDLNFFGGGSVPQWFPFYVYDEDGSNRRENITDWALGEYRARYGEAVTKWDIFHAIYGLLHSPEYRTRYAANLKRDLPRIPFVPVADFWRFVEAGRRLAAIHIGYEQAAFYQLRHIENRAVPWTWRVEKMKLSKDKTALVVNESLTLEGIPAEVFDYKLGNRSALEWVIDQYQVSVDKRSGIESDPNDQDDPEAIVRLVKQVVTVSVETVDIVASLPALAITSEGAA